MTLQQKQGAVSAKRIEPDCMEPPIAPMTMPKQVLTAEPGQLRRALLQMHARLTLGRQGLRRAG